MARTRLHVAHLPCPRPGATVGPLTNTGPPILLQPTRRRTSSGSWHCSNRICGWRDHFVPLRERGHGPGVAQCVDRVPQTHRPIQVGVTGAMCDCQETRDFAQGLENSQEGAVSTSHHLTTPPARGAPRPCHVTTRAARAAFARRRPVPRPQGGRYRLVPLPQRYACSLRTSSVPSRIPALLGPMLACSHDPAAPSLPPLHRNPYAPHTPRPPPCPLPGTTCTSSCSTAAPRAPTTRTTCPTRGTGRTPSSRCLKTGCTRWRRRWCAYPSWTRVGVQKSAVMGGCVRGSGLWVRGADRGEGVVFGWLNTAGPCGPRRAAVQG